jgi:hypothetical protein
MSFRDAILRQECTFVAITLTLFTLESRSKTPIQIAEAH